MLTAETITDEQIRELQYEAERVEDLEVVRDCLRARRDDGRGCANPYARMRCVAILNARAKGVTP